MPKIFWPLASILRYCRKIRRSNERTAEINPALRIISGFDGLNSPFLYSFEDFAVNVPAAPSTRSLLRWQLRNPEFQEFTMLFNAAVLNIEKVWVRMPTGIDHGCFVDRKDIADFERSVIL